MLSSYHTRIKIVRMERVTREMDLLQDSILADNLFVVVEKAPGS